jgi:hypothetical protein
VEGSPGTGKTTLAVQFLLAGPYRCQKNFGEGAWHAAVRLAEAAIADFEARMREVTPAYERGDRVELHGEVFEVSSYQREGMPGYWLRGETEKLFWPMDLESVLRPVVH